MDPQKWGQPGLTTLGWPRFCSHDVDIIASYRRAGMLWMSSKLHTEFGRSFSVLTLLWLHRRCKACQQALLSRKIESIEYITPSLVYHSTVGTADIFHYITCCISHLLRVCREEVFGLLAPDHIISTNGLQGWYFTLAPNSSLFRHLISLLHLD